MLKDNLLNLIDRLNLEITNDLTIAQYKFAFYYQIMHGLITTEDDIFNKLEHYGVTFTISPLN
jgi:hypothetical protein